MSEHRRIAVLYLENKTIGDGFFSIEVARTLREYADMVERGEAGHSSCEKHSGARGTELTVIGVSWRGVQVPNLAQDWLPPPAFGRREEE